MRSDGKRGFVIAGDTNTESKSRLAVRGGRADLLRNLDPNEFEDKRAAFQGTVAFNRQLIYGPKFLPGAPC